MIMLFEHYIILTERQQTSTKSHRDAPCVGLITNAHPLPAEQCK